MALSNTALPVGNYGMVAGSRQRDVLTGVGAQIVLAGGGEDVLSGDSSKAADGLTDLLPWLVGGEDNDQYYTKQAQKVIISDLAGGEDAVYIDSMRFKNAQFRTIADRDILISSGETQVLLVDPAGRSSRNNEIERIVFADREVKGRKLQKAAAKAKAFWGKTTLAEQSTLGTLPLEATGIDLNLFDGYLSSISYNNGLVF
jgi:hypothetical protein